MKMLLTANMRTMMMTALLIAPLVCAGTRALAAPVTPDLPAPAALTNLRSPTGRIVYLVLRPQAEQAAQIEARAARLAAAISQKATARTRAAGALFVVEISHPDAGLDVHRRGRHLTIDAGPLTSLQRTLAATAGLRLREGRPDGDLDQEILLQARRALRDKEEVPESLVALAQGAAARVVLARYVTGDDLGVVLFAARHAALLTPHPDAALLRDLVRAANMNLDSIVPDDEPKNDPMHDGEKEK